jgi:hypothetical protein
MTMQQAFSGSYTLNDVHFLLKPMQVENTPLHEKEAQIKSGKKHYSQMLTHESLPDAQYIKLFHQALVLNQQRMAEHLLILAQQTRATRPDGITLVSLARAGTPIGVLLKHVLKRHFQTEAAHYSISIIRDIGIDQNALKYILQNHAPETLVFVDGWTGKGVIARQLTESLEDFERSTGVFIPAELYVLTDLSGHAAISAASDDYLIPSSIMNATVSGLISRSVYDPSYMNPADFHACLYYHEFAKQDLSGFFVNEILACVDRLDGKNIPFFQTNRLQLQQISADFLQSIKQQYGVSDPNYIKPGIGEATRVLLRRDAQLLLLRDLNAEATRHLHWLAETKAIPFEVDSSLPYQAAALIR